jgi:hypothetical protein
MGIPFPYQTVEWPDRETADSQQTSESPPASYFS